MTHITTAELHTPSLEVNWKSLFSSFNGRIGRKAFWIGIGIIAAASVAVQAVVFSVVNYSDVEMASMVASLLFVYPLLAVGAKRCHDRNKSGWWQIILIFPLIGAIWMIYELGILPTENDGNEYGPNPQA